MILNNMTNYLKTLMLIGGVYYQGALIGWNSPFPVKDVSGTERTTYSIASTYSNQLPQVPLNNFGAGCFETDESSTRTGESTFMIGAGATPVTADDYCLESPITSGVSSVSGSSTFSYARTIETTEDGKLHRIVDLTFTIKNTSSTAIEVNEVGFYNTVYGSQSYCILLHREVLKTPVTIEPGGFGSFSFEFEFTNSVT